ncbi:MAG: hypothetical protein JSS56_27970 [Proteobacteria bacterium]|nr:hypothetical protein [Pseudomonadota bacterium]
MTFVPSRRAVLVAGTAALAAAACSPTFNWREVPVGGDAELVALLPCKPDRAERDLRLGSQPVAVRMIGCEAGGATFAVAQAGASDAMQAQSWMAAWQSQARAQWAGSSIDERPATVPRAAAVPAPLQFAASGQAAAEKRPGQQVRQLWFAHQQRNGTVSLYQATVLGAPSAPEAVQTFFEGMRLP